MDGEGSDRGRRAPEHGSTQMSRVWLVDESSSSSDGRESGVPSSWRPGDPESPHPGRIERWADLEGADLHGASLTGADLRDSCLRSAVLDDANLFEALLVGADLSGASLRGGFLYRADLRLADLEGADLTGADLRGANLIGANLNGADFTDAELTAAEVDTTALDVAIIKHTVMPEGRRMSRTKGGKLRTDPDRRGAPVPIEDARKAANEAARAIRRPQRPSPDTPGSTQ